MWLFIALLGHLMNAFVFLTDKAFVEKIFPSPKALAFIAGGSSIFMIPLLVWFYDGGPTDAIVVSIFSGMVGIGALVCFFTVIGKDEVSRVVPAVGSLTPLWTFLLSYFFLGERFETSILVGFLLLVVGGILVAFRSFSSLFHARALKLFFFEILVGLLFATEFVAQKYGFNAMDDFSSFLFARTGGFLAALPLLFSAEVRERLHLREIRGGGVKKGVLYVVSRIFAGVSPLVITLAISFGSATLVNALQGVQYVFLYVLALFFSRRFPDIFKEERGRGVLLAKTAALVSIGAGLVLIR